MSAIIILLIKWNRIESLYSDNYFLRRELFCYVYLPSFIPSKERRRGILEYSDKNNVEYRFIETIDQLAHDNIYFSLDYFNHAR